MCDSDGFVVADKIMPVGKDADTDKRKMTEKEKSKKWRAYKYEKTRMLQAKY